MRRFLRSKLHKATVTDASLEYEGSIIIDEDLLDLVGIKVYEFVLVANMNNGERFETYVIPGERGKGDICLNGSAARKGLKGDRVIIFAFEFLGEDEIAALSPEAILLPNEPYLFTAEDAKEFEQIFPGATPLLFPGEWLCWYGARTFEQVERLRNMRKIRGDTSFLV